MEAKRPAAISTCTGINWNQQDAYDLIYVLDRALKVKPWGTTPDGRTALERTLRARRAS
jgi:NADH:ubiquinone oxidoreductase subunit E